jgi:hypothetical protein
MTGLNYRCPICDLRFVDAKARNAHLISSARCNIIEELGRLRFLLADREEALAITRQQRDEAREAQQVLKLKVT